MNFLSGFGEASDVSDKKSKIDYTPCKETLEKFKKLMGDDRTKHLDDTKPEGRTEDRNEEVKAKLSEEEIKDKFNKLFEEGDFFRKSDASTMENSDTKSENSTESIESPESIESTESNEGTESIENTDNNESNNNDLADGNDNNADTSEKREPNSRYEIDGDIYETDDNGDTYKKNGKLLPNTEYKVNGSTYRTNEYGNIISCDSNPSYTKDGARNLKEQKESGGEDRQEDDEGGHIIARVLGGAEGVENLIPMRRTINRGDYEVMEGEIASALQDGKEVTVHVDIEYDGDSKRPSTIRVEYTIDGKKTEVVFDNDNNSIELVDSLDGKISDEDYDNLKQEIEDMKTDNMEVSVISVKTEYDDNGNPSKITVIIRNETTGEKSHKHYDPR